MPAITTTSAPTKVESIGTFFIGLACAAQIFAASVGLTTLAGLDTVPSAIIASAAGIGAAVAFRYFIRK